VGELKSCKVLFEKSKEKPFGILSLGEEDKIRTDINEIGHTLEASYMGTSLSMKTILHRISTNSFRL
jgi:hypothetical protein